MSRPGWVFNRADDAGGVMRQLAQGIRANVYGGEHSMLSIVHLEPNAEGRIHSHPEEQWGVLLEGACIRIQDGEEVAMQVGDFWHTPGNVLHGVRAGAEGAVVLDVFSPPRAEYRQAGSGFGGDDG